MIKKCVPLMSAAFTLTERSKNTFTMGYIEHSHQNCVSFVLISYLLACDYAFLRYLLGNKHFACNKPFGANNCLRTEKKVWKVHSIMSSKVLVGFSLKSSIASKKKHIIVCWVAHWLHSCVSFFSPISQVKPKTYQTLWLQANDLLVKL